MFCFRGCQLSELQHKFLLKEEMLFPFFLVALPVISMIGYCSFLFFCEWRGPLWVEFHECILLLHTVLRMERGGLFVSSHLDLQNPGLNWVGEEYLEKLTKHWTINLIWDCSNSCPVGLLTKNNLQSSSSASLKDQITQDMTWRPKMFFLVLPSAHEC